MNDMDIIFMGSSDFALPALTLLNEYHTIKAVYTKEPKPSGRGMKLKKTPIHLKAESLDLPVLTPKNFKASDTIDILYNYKADIIIVAAYGLILPKKVLEACSLGAINIHGSILPAWRGAAPIHRAIINGDKEIGVTIMCMSEGLDEGDMLKIWKTPLTDEMTTGSAHDLLAQKGAETLIEVLKIGKDYKKLALPQPQENISYAQKIIKEECAIDFNQPVKNILRFIRGLNPFPGAFTFVNNKRVKIFNAISIETSKENDPYCFECADGFIKATLIQEEGKNKKHL